MSYCRFSSDNWKSDIYCYESVGGGYVTEVAGQRPAGEVPPASDVQTATYQEWQESYLAQIEALEDLVPIGLPEDGQTFTDDTLDELLARLLWLRGLGYHVPEGAFEEIREERRGRE